MQGIHETLDAMRGAVGWSERRAAILAAPPAPLLPGAEVAAAAMLTEDRGKAWLARHGIPVPQGRVVSAAGVRDAAAGIGNPVVLKMMSEALPHKSEAGAVALGLADAAALAAALARMRRAVAAHAPDAVRDRILVEAMSPPPLAEPLVSLRAEAKFGAALVLGSGGILTEVVGDAVTLLLPASAEEIARALASLRAARLLAGFRGCETADIPAIAAALHGLCEAFLRERARIVEIEINPLFVYRDRIVAVDALIREARR